MAIDIAWLNPLSGNIFVSIINIKMNVSIQITKDLMVTMDRLAAAEQQGPDNNIRSITAIVVISNMLRDLDKGPSGSLWLPDIQVCISLLPRYNSFYN